MFSSIARLALEGIEKEFPYQPSHAHLGPAEWERPRDLHPVFYGCYDWHSAVHAHWSLVRIARLFPDLPVASDIPPVLRKRLNGPDLRLEADYF
ncbi:MAG: DUF2891 family protein [Verrucomicrobiota bacterium]